MSGGGGLESIGLGNIGANSFFHDLPRKSSSGSSRRRRAKQPPLVKMRSLLTREEQAEHRRTWRSSRAEVREHETDEADRLYGASAGDPGIRTMYTLYVVNEFGIFLVAVGCGASARFKTIAAKIDALTSMLAKMDGDTPPGVRLKAEKALQRERNHVEAQQRKLHSVVVKLFPAMSDALLLPRYNIKNTMVRKNRRLSKEISRSTNFLAFGKLRPLLQRRCALLGKVLEEPSEHGTTVCHDPCSIVVHFPASYRFGRDRWCVGGAPVSTAPLAARRCTAARGASTWRCVHSCRPRAYFVRISSCSTRSSLLFPGGAFRFIALRESRMTMTNLNSWTAVHVLAGAGRRGGKEGSAPLDAGSIHPRHGGGGSSRRRRVAPFHASLPAQAAGSTRPRAGPVPGASHSG